MMTPQRIMGMKLRSCFDDTNHALIVCLVMESVIERNQGVQTQPLVKINNVSL